MRIIPSARTSGKTALSLAVTEGWFSTGSQIHQIFIIGNVERIHEKSVDGKFVEIGLFFGLDCFLQLTNRCIRLNLDWESVIFVDDKAGYCING